VFLYELFTDAVSSSEYRSQMIRLSASRKFGKLWKTWGVI